MMPTTTYTRRNLLRKIAPGGSSRMLFRPETERRGDVLITIFLRGGMDGLHTVPPHADPAYHRHRATLAVSDPGTSGGCLDLNGYFGLHPTLAPLQDLFRAGRL